MKQFFKVQIPSLRTHRGTLPTFFSVLDPLEKLSDPQALDIYSWLRKSFEELRHERFVEQTGWEAARTDHRETDHFDSVSPYLVEATVGTVVQGCRLLFRDRIGTLPIETYLRDHVVPKDSVEISRMATKFLFCTGDFYRFLGSILYAEVGPNGFAYTLIREKYHTALRRRGLQCAEVLPMGLPFIKINRDGLMDAFIPVRFPVKAMWDDFQKF